MSYFTAYPKKPIGDGNPYYCYACCGVSDPEINGRLDRNKNFCEYRAKMVLAGNKDD